MVSKKKDKTDAEKKGVALLLSENIECLAIAIAMALILKFYIIEAYKIPSGSMQPTIIGNDDTGIYDRVLVNKFLYLLDSPERWNVIVFKYPLNRSQNYIKRLIGLPGEKVTIKNGDIYIDDRIARKPEKVLSSVMKQVFPLENGVDSINRAFTITGQGAKASADSVTLPAGGRVEMRGIRDKYLHGYDPDWKIPFPPRVRPAENHFVGDLDLSFEVTLDSAKGGVMATIEENNRVHTFFLRGAQCADRSYMETRTKNALPDEALSRVWSSKEVFLDEGDAVEVKVANIDDRLSIQIDGDEVAAHEYTTEAVESGRLPNVLRLGPVDSGATFDEVAVYRDIYYTNDSSQGFADFHVPHNHYFALGDNTQNSSDGRRWQSFELLHKDGRTIKGEYTPGRFPPALNSPNGIDPCTVLDLNGDPHVVCGKDLRDHPETDNKKVLIRLQPEPFIHEKYMLGKAMAVFWPIYPHFRWKLIR